MVSPTADAGNPRFKKIEVAGVELAREILEQENPENLLFENTPGEQLIGDLNQEFESMLIEDLAPRFACQGPKVIRVPAVGFDVFFEEPLHASCVLWGAAALELGSNLAGGLLGG